jgi:hypothetical protein
MEQQDNENKRPSILNCLLYILVIFFIIYGIVCLSGNNVSESVSSGIEIPEVSNTFGSLNVNSILG